MENKNDRKLSNNKNNWKIKLKKALSVIHLVKILK